MTKDKFEHRLLERLEKQNGAPIDERVEKENSLAIGAAFTFGVVLDIVMLIYYFITRNIEGAYPYILQLVVMGAALMIAQLSRNSDKPPQTMYGKQIGCDSGFGAFMKRVLLCSAEMLVLAALLIGFHIYTDRKITGSIFTDALIAASVLILIDVIICEHRVRRYRRYLARINDEEDELD